MSDDGGADSGRGAGTGSPRTNAAGQLAAGVVAELVRPLRELREDLAVLVELFDRHMAEARGPKGLTWRDVETLRQQLADNYLRSRRMTRLVSELADAIAPAPLVPEIVDVNKLVESALNLARHRMAADTEVFVDLGSIPLVRAVAGELLLAISQILAVAADSAGGAEGSAISIKTRRGADDGDDVVIRVADNGRGLPAAAAQAGVLAVEVAERAGGSYVGTSEPGKGSFFELRIASGRRR